MTDIAEVIAQGITLTAEAAEVAAPIVSIYNPVAGTLLATLAPVVAKFVVTETQVLLELRKDVTRDELIAALQASKSANWNIKPLETSEG